MQRCFLIPTIQPFQSASCVLATLNALSTLKAQRLVQLVIVASCCRAIRTTVHYLKLVLRTLRTLLFLSLLSRYELEYDDKKLLVVRFVLEDVSERVCAWLVRPLLNADMQKWIMRWEQNG